MTPALIQPSGNPRWPWMLNSDFSVMLPGLIVVDFDLTLDGVTWVVWSRKWQTLKITNSYAFDGVTVPGQGLAGIGPMGLIGRILRILKAKLDANENLLRCALIHDALLQCAEHGFCSRADADKAFAHALEIKGVRGRWFYARAVKLWSRWKGE